MASPSQDDKELKNYLKTADELSEELNQEIEHIVEDENSSSPSRLKKLHFWSDWPKKKKVIALVSAILGLILILSLIFFFVVRPKRSSSYIKSSWHDLASSTSSIDRALKAEVNLEGTRELSNELYSYNEKLNAKSYEAKSKSTLTYTNSVQSFGELANSMAEYISKSATVLNKTDSDIEAIAESELEDLRNEGQSVKDKVDQFRQTNKIDEEINPDVFALDSYISNVKLKKEEIEQEKKDEEAKKKREASEAKAKDAKDAASVKAVAESYFTAFVNGNEQGVRATLSKGYQGEYDFGALSSERRTSWYPKSYRIVDVVKDGDKYKVTGSVTYISVYQDSEGNNVENTQPSTEIYRVVYSTETESWKIDGRTES